MTRYGVSSAVHGGTTIAGSSTQTQEPSPIRGFQTEPGQVASDVALQVRDAMSQIPSQMNHTYLRIR